MKLVYIHGLGGVPRSEIAEEVAKELGFELVYVDYSNAVENAGWMRKILNIVGEQIPREPHLLMGHSFGSLLSLYLQNAYTHAIVLLSPALALNIGVRLTIQADLMRKGIFYYEAEKPVEMDREDVRLFFRMIRDAPQPRKPFIIIVGEEDHLLDVNGILKFFRRNKQRKGWYVEILRSDHSFKEKEAEVAGIVSTFLRNVL